MQVMGWIFTILLLVVVLALALAVAVSAGDIRRYRQIKRM